jgi:hypothetical protein
MKMSHNSKEIVTKDKNGNELKLIVKKPTAKQLLDARTAAIEVVSKALDSNAKTREQMLEFLKERQIFGEKDEAKLQELEKKISAGTRQLARGGLTPEGNPFTKEDGRKLAFEIQDWRAEQIMLSFKRRELDQYTVQGQADNAEFNHLVSKCVFTEDGDLFFSSLEDYLDQQDETYSFEAAKALAEITNKVDGDYEKKLPENAFLIKYGFARESDLALINEDGHLIDRDNRLINEKGRFVNEDDEFVDKSGNKVNEDGNPVEEFVEFA